MPARPTLSAGMMENSSLFSASGAPPGSFAATGLGKLYRTGDAEVHALRGVDLAIAKGEMLVLLGPSGSGKSTLLNILGGLDRPTSGRLWFGDEELTGLDDAGLTRFRRGHVGFIFQFYNLIPSLTALENVRLVTDIAEHPMDAATALDRVGLANRQHNYPAQLSGGEQQRVAVARAIAKQPQVLLCDEPTGALDSATGVHVLAALAQANHDLGATVVIITHNIGIAAMAHRVIHFRDGQIAREEFNDRPVAPAEISW
jgi:putative ABC transport system ATP-binding protein